MKSQHGSQGHSTWTLIRLVVRANPRVLALYSCLVSLAAALLVAALLVFGGSGVVPLPAVTFDPELRILFGLGLAQLSFLISAFSANLQTKLWTALGHNLAVEILSPPQILENKGSREQCAAIYNKLDESVKISAAVRPFLSAIRSLPRFAGFAGLALALEPIPTLLVATMGTILLLFGTRPQRHRVRIEMELLEAAREDYREMIRAGTPNVQDLIQVLMRRSLHSARRQQVGEWFGAIAGLAILTSVFVVVMLSHIFPSLSASDTNFLPWGLALFVALSSAGSTAYAWSRFLEFVHLFTIIQGDEASG